MLFIASTHPLLSAASTRRVCAFMNCHCDWPYRSTDAQTEPTVGIDNKRYVEKKLEQLSDEASKDKTRSFQKPGNSKYVPNRFGTKSGSAGYDAGADAVHIKREEVRSICLLPLVVVVVEVEVVTVVQVSQSVCNQSVMYYGRGSQHRQQITHPLSSTTPN